jgi:hypothetical protein
LFRLGTGNISDREFVRQLYALDTMRGSSPRSRTPYSPAATAAARSSANRRRLQAILGSRGAEISSQSAVGYSPSGLPRSARPVSDDLANEAAEPESAGASDRSDLLFVWETFGASFLQAESKHLGSHIGNYGGGMIVSAVRREGPLDRGKIKSGDVLVGLHRYKTKSYSDIAYVGELEGLKTLSPIKAIVIREGELKSTLIDVNDAQPINLDDEAPETEPEPLKKRSKNDLEENDFTTRPKTGEETPGGDPRTVDIESEKPKTDKAKSNSIDEPDRRPGGKSEVADSGEVRPNKPQGERIDVTSGGDSAKKGIDSASKNMTPTKTEPAKSTQVTAAPTKVEPLKKASGTASTKSLVAEQPTKTTTTGSSAKTGELVVTKPTADEEKEIWERIGLKVEIVSGKLPTPVLPNQSEAAEKLPAPIFNKGLRLLEVKPDSPAGRAKMRPGDILVVIDRVAASNGLLLLYAIDLVDRQNPVVKYYLFRDGNEKLVDGEMTIK